MAILKPTIQTKKSLIVIITRYISLAILAVAAAIAFPMILASTFTAPNHSFIYDQSTADFYGFTATVSLVAILSLKIKIDQRVKKIKTITSFSLMIALILGIVTTIAVWLGITNIIGVVPTIAETKAGNILFAIIQVGILGVATKYFWNAANTKSSKLLATAQTRL